MTHRLLPRSEWGVLAGTETAFVLAEPEDTVTQVLAVEDEGRLVGSWAFKLCWHAEGLWVAPDHRGRGAVGRHLLTGMREIAAQAGVRGFVTAALTATVARLIRRVGGRELPGTAYVVPVR